jgi:uncharacterized protein YjbI with pentapeptide repeats
MRYFYTLIFSLFLITGARAQTVVFASDILEKINRGENVEYANVTIEGVLDLTDLSNRKRTDVTRSLFGNDSEKFESSVEVALRFTNCVFSDDVLAYYNNEDENTLFLAHFEEDVLFRNCVFKNASEFKYSEFDERVDFTGTLFEEDANFKYAEFNDRPVFAKVHFEEEANFKYAEFPEETDFSAAIFDEEANFKYAEFPSGVSFAGARFNDLANFKYTKFSSPLNMDAVDFKGDEDFKYTEVDGRSFTAYLLKRE